MPTAGTLALTSFLSTGGSSSRKGTPTEITSSESRSATPDRLPSKRRRLSPPTIFDPNPSPPSSRQLSPDHFDTRSRFEGDGYGYRRPIMATRSQRQTATPAPNDVVDLTHDDSDDASTTSEDSPSSQVSTPPSRPQSRPARVATWRQAAHQQQQGVAAVEARREAQRQFRFQAQFQRAAAQGFQHQRLMNRAELLAAEQQRPQNIQSMFESHQRQMEQRQQDPQPRAPPFGQRGQDRPIIILSDGEDSDFGLDEFDIPSDAETNDSNSVVTIDSPEVQFIEERPIPQPQRPQAEIAADVAHMDRVPVEAGAFALNLPNLLRRGTQVVFGNVQNTLRGYNEGFLDRLDGVPRRNQANEGGAIPVAMDYGRAAFAMGFGPFDRSSETPQVVQEPYKAPPAAKEGFTRTFGEEDIILCPMCGDELAIGKGDVKQQVWVVKGCGHVYCGECATNRSKAKTRKSKGKENEQKLESARSQPFSICQADDCTVKVASKAAMFPIYL